jgi:hypothetical protein
MSPGKLRAAPVCHNPQVAFIDYNHPAVKLADADFA